MRKILLRGLWLLLLIAVAIGAYLTWVATIRLKPGNDTYVVEAGMGLRAFNKSLYRARLLPDPVSLVILAYARGDAQGLKAGEYRFRAGITPLQLLRQVVAGRVVEYPLLVVEGWTFAQMLTALNTAPKLTHTLAGVAPAEIMRRLGHPDIHPEGRFFPDTYYYARGSTDIGILQAAFTKMEAFLASEWAARDAGLPLKTMDEALTLASIVERETGQVDERRLIAGVFVNRLRKRMRLQTDPTVIYGMGAQYRGNIRLRDLRQPTPYNTYVIYGLPPTPIALPGADAIRASLHPAQTDALYFVSRGDGTHVFSATLSAHNQAVAEFQLRRRRAK